MPLPSAIVSPAITDKLGGEPGLGKVMAWLWPADCQTCGRPLGREDPALCVDEFGDTAAASVHHPGCRASEWNDTGQIPSGGRYITYRTRMFLLPASDGAAKEYLPAFMLNPALECVFLGRDGNDSWSPQVEEPFPSCGLLPPGPDLVLDKPARGMSARVTGSGVTVLLPRTAAEHVYSCPFSAGDERFRDAVRQKAGIMLAVTHAADPDAEPPELLGRLQQALSTGRVLLGWVPLADG